MHNQSHTPTPQQPTPCQQQQGSGWVGRRDYTPSERIQYYADACDAKHKELSAALRLNDALVAALRFLTDELDGLEGTIGTFGPDWAQVARDQARAALAASEKE